MRKSPTSLTTLVKPNMKMISAAKRVYRSLSFQRSVPHQHEMSRSGSTTKAKDVKVAMWRA